MRELVIAALVTFVVAGVGYVFARDLPPPEAGALSSDAASADVLAAAGEESPAAETAVASAAPAGAKSNAGAEQTFYQWVDGKGSVRFARSLAEVPPAWRERAGQVSVSTDDLIRPDRPSTRTARARRASSRTGTDAPVRNASHDVTIYTAPWCGWCRKTIAFLDERGVDYVNKNIDEDPDHKEELREKSGGTSIPLVEIDGALIRGYNPNEMAALLE